MLRWRTIIVACLAAISGCGHHAPITHAAASTFPQQTVTIGGWRIRVTERPQRIGQLQIASTSVARTNPPSPQTWIATSLKIHNSGDHPVRLELAPISTFIGNRRLLVAGPDCGYGQRSPSEPVKPGICLTQAQRAPQLAPGKSVKLPIRAYIELPGMSPLAPSSYTAHLRLSIDTPTAPQAQLRLIYNVTRAAARS